MTRARDLSKLVNGVATTKLTGTISSSSLTGAIPDSLLTGVDSDMVQPLIPHAYIQAREADLETVEWNIGNNSNKSVDTWYDFTTTLSAGTWLPLYRGYIWYFENHGSSNIEGAYMQVVYLGSSSQGEQYGNGYSIYHKWGNASNSIGDTCSMVFPKFTIASESTIYSSWKVNEYGTSSNYWIRMSSSRGWTFVRLA